MTLQGAARTGALLVILCSGASSPALAQSVPDSPQVGEATDAPRKHRRRQRRPVQLGTSGGNIEDFTPIGGSVACCGGTLGALLMKGDRYFVLSNNHVLARLNLAAAGEEIHQPGLNDTRCQSSEGDLIGTLSGFQRLKLGGNNRSDAAIAETTPEAVDPSGKLIDIGVPGNEVVNPRVGMPVIKSGRTTGVTRGEVSTTNVTGTVSFAEECGSDIEYDVRFSKVFLVTSTDGKDFSNSGDSGSVIWEDVEACPGAVGLLFAGTEAFTAANPMKIVMRHVRKMAPKGPAKLVGCDPVAALGASHSALRPSRAERHAMRAQARTEEEVLAVPGVVAMGIGRGERHANEVVLRVLVESDRPETMAALPSRIDGVPVEVVVSGKLRALHCPLGDQGPALGGLAANLDEE